MKSTTDIGLQGILPPGQSMDLSLIHIYGGAGLLDGVALVEPLAVRGVDLRVDGLPLRNLVLPLRVHDGVQVCLLYTSRCV